MGSVAVPPGFAEALVTVSTTRTWLHAGRHPPTSAAQPPQTATGSGRVPATGMASPQGLCDTPTQRRADQRFALRLRPGRTP